MLLLLVIDAGKYIRRASPAYFTILANKKGPLLAAPGTCDER